MHNFLLFYAPLLVVVLAMIFSLFVATKSTKYED
ncbi:cytochrome bd oxidase small subunit CydS [Alkalihalobacterium sp. APHAB7]